ncbi:MAG: phosphoadenylyl-sulfate reductase [Thermaerobacter sp.]|nr:phosphoadenylyl-sulfate reductase [Thermaerobacter sp.]
MERVEDIRTELLSRDWEALTAQEAIAWGHERFGAQMVFASSFSLEDVLLIDMACAAGLQPHVFYLDTGVLFAETYELIDRVSERYHIEMERVLPALTLEEQAIAHGEKLWLREPDRCCGIRKVEPLRRYLCAHDAWVTGIHRDQSPTRANAPRVAFDDSFGLVKLNPIVDWTMEDVRNYVAEHDVPYNPMHDRGYPSIGCMPCTRAVKAGEDPRAGRWAGFQKTECGLHSR